MTTNELQHIVLIEAATLLLVCAVIVAAFKRWKITLCVASTLATVGFFTAWSTIMAIGSVLVYGPASILLWLQLDSKEVKPVDRLNKYVHILAWSLLAIGVATLILNNIRNIFIYLSY
jgi:hypothetical protein